jgi:hypothetical protein
MNLRLILLLLGVFLSLSTSADRTTNNCSQVWVPTLNPQVESGLGVNIHFTNPKPGEIKLIAEAGFRWVRMDLNWDATERERGQYDFAAYERLMSELDQFNIRALFILDYGNSIYDGGAPPRTDAARQAYVRWAVAAAKHFQNRGVIWEIYNEPNNSMFWPPKPKAAEYIALALALGRAFRATVPNEKLIGPATSTIDFDFLEACFKAGLLEYWSAVSVHPYRQSGPEEAADEYCRLRELIARYRTGSGRDGVTATSSLSNKDIPIISGEWGYSSAWRNMDEAKQSALLAREMLTNAANGIPISIWYDWRDDGSDPGEAEHHFGIVRNAYQAERNPIYEAKPAYLSAKTLSGFLNGYKFAERLAVGSNDDYVLVFAKGGERRIAAWTNSPTPHRITIPLQAGQYSLTGHIGENRQAVSANESGISIEVSTAPVYLARVTTE